MWILNLFNWKMPRRLDKINGRDIRKLFLRLHLMDWNKDSIYFIAKKRSNNKIISLLSKKNVFFFFCDFSIKTNKKILNLSVQFKLEISARLGWPKLRPHFHCSFFFWDHINNHLIISQKSWRLTLNYLWNISSLISSMM